MTTSRSIKYVLAACVVSRLAVFILQLIVNPILPDHHVDAYENKYHGIIHKENYTQKLSLPYRVIYQSTRGFTQWDAQYFLEISRDGYLTEMHLVFLPLLPSLINLTKSIFRQLTHVLAITSIYSGKLTEGQEELEIIEDYLDSTFTCIILNNLLFFPIAALALYKLTRLVKKTDKSYAQKVVLWFCINPSSIFFSSCYSESLFSAIVFSAMYLMELDREKAEATKSRSSGIETKTGLNQFSPQSAAHLVMGCLPSSVLISLACLTRSNGLLLMGYIGYQFLLKYWPVRGLDAYRGQTFEHKLIGLLELTLNLSAFLLSALIGLSGYALFQAYAYVKTCMRDGKNYGQVRPDWCEAFIPHSYPSIQANYWGVGLLAYWKLKFIPNFLLASPIMYLTIKGFFRHLRDRRNKHLIKSEFVYHLHAMFLALYGLLMIHVQVTTRLLAASCPVIYWYCADMNKTRWIRYYFISYFIIGTIMHTNGLPWT